MSVALVVAVTFLTHLSFASCRVILSLAAIHHQATPLMVGVIVSLVAVVPMFLAISWGRYVDRVGVHGPMLTGSSAVLLAMGLGWAVPRLETLFIVSVVGGSGFILFHIAATQAVGASGPPEARMRNFSLLALAFSTAVAAGSALSGLAIDGVGHHGAFVVLAAGSAVSTGILLVAGRTAPREEKAVRSADERRILDLLRTPALAPVFVASAALSVTWDLYTFVTPIHGTSIELSASAIGLILGVFGAGVCVSRLVLPLLAGHMNEWRMLSGAMVLAAAGLLVYPALADLRALIAISFLLGCALGVTQPMILALLYEGAPAGRRGEVVGVRTLLFNASQATVPLLFGALGTAFGTASAFWLTGVVLLVIAARTRPKKG